MQNTKEVGALHAGIGFTVYRLHNDKS